jgi:hypothetical protein
MLTKDRCSLVHKIHEYITECHMHTIICMAHTLQESQNCDPNLALFRAILARVSRDAGKRHGSPTSAQGGRKLQIGVVVKAVIVRVS